MSDAETERLVASRHEQMPWKRWGPYLSERQWGTVREDYSDNGDAWNYFPHDHARSRAYHWGEDGLAGISDDQQRLCFALALWNGRDPILKERLFGLTNGEGNHGEDVKEYYFYLDSTPTHSYMKWLYKYPQRAYPYSNLVATNRRRSRQEYEYELIDTGVFEDNRYFDVFVEYAKAAPEDILIRVTVINRAPEAAPIDVLPTLWFRNTWRFWPESQKPVLREVISGCHAIAASHAELGERWLYVDGTAPLLFTENETNNARLFRTPNASAWVKDGINDFIVHGRRQAVSANGRGTKAAAHYHAVIDAGASAVFRLRLTSVGPDVMPNAFLLFDRTFELRLREADDFFRSLTPLAASGDAAAVLRQAVAGLLWSKQFYYFDVTRWLEEHGADPFQASARHVRDDDWAHVANADVISMPDKWEYPWFAAWDLAFHAVALAGVDPDFAKSQLELLLGEMYMHPNGQIPASEWNFSEASPPVHAWATIYVYRTEQTLHGRSDVDFLKRSFGKLLSNFTWWLNRRDVHGKNVFEGGFLGLDNIGVFDRSVPLPTGGQLEQADGVAWMALFCQNMLEIAIEIAAVDRAYEDLAVKFVDHFLGIAAGINHVGRTGMWDDDDGFYYDVLRLPNDTAIPLRVRSIVGLLPLCATTVIEPSQRDRVPKVRAHFRERIARQPELLRGIHEGEIGYSGRSILALLNTDRLRRVLSRVLDEREFLSPYGIRALSRVHDEHPYVLRADGREYRVCYTPAESDSGMFGGNANWRGPIWIPMNVLLIRALLLLYTYYGDSFMIECPTGSGRLMHLFDVAHEITARLTGIFLRDERGRRAVYGGTDKFQSDPHWRDCVLFYEYFHGDNGAGLGASHQTGWTGLVALLIRFFWSISASELLESGPTAIQQQLVRQAATHREQPVG